jgi:hypothetical protein
MWVTIFHLVRISLTSTIQYYQHSSRFSTFTHDAVPAASPVIFFAVPPVALVIFFAVPPVALVIFFAVPPVALVALPCALAALTVYRVTVTIAINNTAAVIANDACLCIKSCGINTDIKVLYMEAVDVYIKLSIRL